MSTATGTYFDGQTARGRAVSLEFTANGTLRLSGDGLAEEIELARLQVSDRLGDVPRFIYLPDNAVIETSDNAAIDAALAGRRQSRSSRIIHLLESQQRIAVAACVLLVLGIAALGFYGPPALARWVAKRVPAEIDQRIGAAALVTIAPYFAESSLSLEERNRVREQLARLQPDSSRHPRLEFRSMKGGLPNAFALPGNVIIVTDELVQLPASDDEIAAVLAHELGHLERRHGLQSLLRGSFAVLLVAAVTGDLSALTSFAGTIPLTILTAGYSRDLEREADRDALGLLRARGINPRAFSSALAKLDDAYASLQRNSTYVSTHPATAERMALFGVISPDERNVVLAEAWYDRASAAVRRKEHELAVAHYGRIIELAPTARAYTLRAQSHFERRDYAAADADLTKALELDPTSKEAHAAYVEVLALGLKKYPDAVAAAKKALELHPSDATTTATLGFAETMLGNTSAAATALDRAIELDPANYRGWAYRGYLRSHRNNALALADYDKALELHPQLDWIHYSRGVLRNRERDFTGALADFAAVRDPTRHTGDFFFERGYAQHSLDKTDLALADYNRALEKGVEEALRVTAHMNRAVLHRRKGDHRSALVDLDAAIAREPKNGRAYLERAFAHRRLGEPAKGLADIEQALQAGADERTALRARGNLHWDLEDYSAALRDFDRLLEHSPNASDHRTRGVLHLAIGDWQRAEADLNASLNVTKSRNSDYGEFFRLLARRRGKMNDEPAAFSATVAKWPAGWPKSIGWYLAGEISELQLLAETNASGSPSPNERRCEAYFYIGQMHLLAGDRASAEEFFEKCIGTGAIHYYEHKLARAELKRLRKKP